MRLEWLDDILAVAETGSFQAAAERRHVTQPAFSRRLRAIEESLGVQLFDRTRKPARLMPHALEQAERMRDLACGLRELAESFRRERADEAQAPRDRLPAPPSPPPPRRG